MKTAEEKVNILNKFISNIENDLAYIPEHADLGEYIFDIKNKISKFMSEDYSTPLQPVVSSFDLSYEDVMITIQEMDWDTKDFVSAKELMHKLLLLKNSADLQSAPAVETKQP